MKTLFPFRHRLRRRIYFEWRRARVLLRLFLGRGRRVYLFGCPIHPNLGDLAQTYCIEKWLKANYPKHRLVKLDWSTSPLVVLYLLRLIIRKDDLLFGHSGYFIVDHHRELPVFQAVARIFAGKRFVIFPQTMNLQNRQLRERVAADFQSNSNIVMLCRDRTSYQRATDLFKGCRLLLFPDVVTSLIGTITFQTRRQGILFCKRTGRESHYNSTEINELRSRFTHQWPTEISDTSVDLSLRDLEGKRDWAIFNMLNRFATFRLVITDRYHGTIFAAIAGTPVIVLDSADHKLRSGVHWFPPAFHDYIMFASSLDEAHDLAIKSLAMKYDYRLPQYFEKEYYSQLKYLLCDPVEQEPISHQTDHKHASHGICT